MIESLFLILSLFAAPELSSLYQDNVISLNVGEEYIWTNNHNLSHTITTGSPFSGPTGVFDSGLMLPGTSFRLIIDEVGQHEFFCLVHPWERGIITIGSSFEIVPSSNISPEQRIAELEAENQDLRNQIEMLKSIILEQLNVIYQWIISR